MYAVLIRSPSVCQRASPHRSAPSLSAPRSSSPRSVSCLQLSFCCSAQDRQIISLLNASECQLSSWFDFHRLVVCVRRWVAACGKNPSIHSSHHSDLIHIPSSTPPAPSLPLFQSGGRAGGVWPGGARRHGRPPRRGSPKRTCAGRGTQQAARYCSKFFMHRYLI